jgi:tetratricopeptide (TPR) repeat protein
MSEADCRESMLQGHAARKAGRKSEALDHYRRALEHEPSNAEANSVYGLMLLQLGRADEAEAPLRKAVEIAPLHAAVQMNLAQWLMHENRLDEARALVVRVVADEPQQWWAWERLGDLKARMRRFEEAASHFGQAAKLKPHDPSLLFKLARATFDTGRADEAERILGDAARLAPGHPAILRLYAELHESRGNWSALEAVARAWTAAQPKEHRAWRSLAKAQWETGWLRHAMQSFRTSLDLGGRTAESLATFGRLCLSALEYHSAAAALDEAEALDPGSAHLLSAKSVLLMFSGRYEEAESYCRRALAVNRSDASAYKVLSQLSSGRLPKDDLAALQQIIDRGDLRLQDRITAAYAFADCLEVQADADLAFAAYERANRLALEYAQAEGITYDRAARRTLTDELIAIFDSVAEPASDGPGPRPVFIVGMPRSGTTLIESVIAAHSRVHAGGERMALRWILQDFLSRARIGLPSGITEGAWQGWRDFFRQESLAPPEAAVITDKNPWNFDAIALILRLFPDARIIHVRRNPVDTGLSIFRNQFPKTQPFANRLEDIGHYYGEYARLMAHWQSIATGRFTTVQYEDFVREFDTAGPALLDACGLDWEKSCHNFWETRRVISTMSTMQARRPLENCAGKTALYAAHLAPLVAALDEAGVDLETGARILDARAPGPV